VPGDTQLVGIQGAELRFEHDDELHVTILSCARPSGLM
jgi:hypothetical protein